jgi:hypothetical protein
MEKFNLKILNYQVLIENSICWSRRDDFFKIMDDFVNGKINGDIFEDEYSTLKSEIREKCENYENLIDNGLINSESEVEIHFTPTAKDFSKIVFGSLFYLVEGYSSDITDTESSSYGYSENGLKKLIKNDILPRLAKYRKKKLNDKAIILNYRVLIETSICWSRKDDFLKIIDDFVNGRINGNIFQNKYFTIRNEILIKSDNYQNLIENGLLNSESEVEIHFIPTLDDFSTIIFLRLFDFVESYSFDITDTESNSYRYSENELKKRVKYDIIPSLAKYRKI